MEGAESVVCRLRRECNIEGSGAVIERPYCKALRLRDGLEELVNFSFEHLSTEPNTINPSNHSVKTVRGICASFVQLSHYMRESPVGNWLCEEVFPIPVGVGDNLKCRMYFFGTVDSDDSIGQVLGSFNCIARLDFSDRKSFGRSCCSKTFTRDVPTHMGSLLKSLESDVDGC